MVSSVCQGIDFTNILNTFHLFPSGLENLREQMEGAKKGQLNHPLALMHEGNYTVPSGIAVQDGNYTGKTGADIDCKENKDKGDNSRRNIVPLLHGFAKDFLRANYMFWVNQEPYFEEDVIPCFTNE